MMAGAPGDAGVGFGGVDRDRFGVLVVRVREQMVELGEERDEGFERDAVEVDRG